MIIGYTVKKNEVERHRLEVEGNCETIYEVTDDCHIFKDFELFLNDHMTDTIVMVDLSSSGLPIGRWLDVVGVIETNQITIHFLDKELESNQEYLRFLKKISEIERNFISSRTLLGLEKARKEGRFGGRPQISSKKISKIQDLYHIHKRSLRDISEIAGVSLGTAHKYANLISLDENEPH